MHEPYIRHVTATNCVRHLLKYLFVHSYTVAECGDPSEKLARYVSITSLNKSFITLSCDEGYSFHGSKESQCVQGEWSPSPELVMCLKTETTTSELTFL